MELLRCPRSWGEKNETGLRLVRWMVSFLAHGVHINQPNEMWICRVWNHRESSSKLTWLSMPSRSQVFKQKKKESKTWLSGSMYKDEVRIPRSINISTLMVLSSASPRGLRDDDELTRPHSCLNLHAYRLHHWLYLNLFLDFLKLINIFFKKIKTAGELVPRSQQVY
jgi:hypothetical protein